MYFSKEKREAQVLTFLVSIAEDDFFELFEDRGGFVDAEEVAGGEVGDERGGGNDAELRESLEERVVGGHEGEEFGHGVGDAGGNEAGDEHFFGGFYEVFVDELVARAAVEDEEENQHFYYGADALRPAEAFGAVTEVIEEDGEADGGADGEDADDEGCAGVLVGVEAARGDVEDAAGENRHDEGAEDGGDEHVAAVHDEVDDVAAGKEGDE